MTVVPSTNARSSNSGCCGIMRRNHHSHETSSSSSSTTGNDNMVSDTESPSTVFLLSDDPLQETAVPTSNPEQPPNKKIEQTIENNRNTTSSGISNTHPLFLLAGPHSLTLYLVCIVLLIFHQNRCNTLDVHITCDRTRSQKSRGKNACYLLLWMVVVHFVRWWSVCSIRSFVDHDRHIATFVDVIQQYEINLSTDYASHLILHWGDVYNAFLGLFFNHSLRSGS